ncbi:MAG TPA: hypothetical protein IAC02_10860 [Candidatus Coprovivens excrementavium]|nr:hypothetical protein [Candidatus Coprovivens excrementavium]
MKKVQKYIISFLIISLSLFILQNLVARIPKKLTEQNIKESIVYYQNIGGHSELFNITKTPLKYSFQVDNYSECIILNMIWNLEPTFTSQIKMNYYEEYEGGVSCDSLIKAVEENKEGTTEYSRYWHGSITIIKPLLIFFNVNQIRILLSIIIIILTIYLTVIMFKKSKLLAIFYILGLLSINFFTIFFCLEYYFVFLITTIISIITIKTIDKNDSFFYFLLLISGITTCYFDFLTCETLSLTIPLLIRTILKNKNYDKKKYLIFFFKSCLIWLLSYAFMFVLKWLLSIIVLGFDQMIEIWSDARLRIYKTDYDNPVPYILSMLINMPSYLLPFALSQKSIIYIFIYTLILIWLYIFCLDKKSQKTSKKLLLICIIPITRYLVLYSHALIHYFFDYRALLPIVIVTLYILYGGIKNEVNNLNTMLKRRRNNCQSHKSRS